LAGGAQGGIFTSADDQAAITPPLTSLTFEIFLAGVATDFLTLVPLMPPCIAITAV